MFDIGFSELLLIAVVALVVLGPERLPGAARTLGALLRRVRDGWSSVRAEVERELQTEELRQTVKDAADSVRNAQESMRDSVRRAEEEIRRTGDAVTGKDDSAAAAQDEQDEQGSQDSGEAPEGSTRPKSVTDGSGHDDKGAAHGG